MSLSNVPSTPKSTRPSLFRSISSSSAVQEFTQTLAPRKDKPRLYLALWPRGGTNLTSSYSSSITCDSYHWTFLVGPQTPARKEPGTCFQIVHTSPPAASSSAYSSSYYEETDLTGQSQTQSEALLVRITLAKVVDEDRLRKLLRSLPPSTPPTSSHSSHSDSDYDTDDLHGICTCLTWVKAAYKMLICDTRCLRGYVGPDDWPDVEEVVRLYARKKRRQGRFGGPGGIAEAYRTWKDDEIPTWNFWENRETTA